MNAAQTLTIVTAASLLLVADYVRRQTNDGDDQSSAPDWSDEVNATISEAISAAFPGPVTDMRPSADLVGALKRSEALRLTRYRLGDGGWTIGYGRYYADGATPPPESIDVQTAEAWFVDDLDARGAKWVRAYVKVPLMQYQFDALVSMAFNLKPTSFRNIANAVNDGQDPEAQALRYIREGTGLEAGLRNRRAKEMAMYRQGVYA